MRLICLLLLALPLASVEIPRYDTHDFSFTATAPGNPFDVAVTGHFEGPGGERLSVPRYYDGANTWRIRFSPAAEGK